MLKTLAQMLTILYLLTGCGADDHKSPATPPITEGQTFSIEKLQARFDLLAKGRYYFNDEKDDWVNSPSLLPLSASGGLYLVGGERVESSVTCGGKTLKRITQTFIINLEGRALSGSSDFVVLKLTALDHVFEVVRSEITLGDQHVTMGDCE